MLETLDLQGKTAIVTGAGRGLGKAMAKSLAQAGAQVVCAARTQEQIDGTVSEIVADGGAAVAVTSSEQVDALVTACLEQYGKLDIMIANAGGGVASSHEFWEFEDDEFEAVLALNLKSAFYSGRAASKVMVERGEGGVIINVASGTALRGNRGFAYPTAKGGVISLTKSEATMLWPHNIRVNVIVPGYVSQAPAEDGEEENLRRNRGRFIPVRRLGEWWELGPLAVYLSSDASRYVTGEQFIIDGAGLAGGVGPTGYAPLHELDS